MEIGTLIRIGSAVLGVGIIIFIKWRWSKKKPNKEVKKEKIEEEVEHIDKEKYQSI